MGTLLKSSPEPNEQCMNCFVDFRPLELYYRCILCDDAMHPRCAGKRFWNATYDRIVWESFVCTNCILEDK